jgi:hypothetical protein
MAENQVYLIKSGQNSFVEETEAIVGISGGKVGIGTTAPEADLHVTGSVKIGGDLAVDGTFTTINSSTISVDDKNIELGSTDSPTDITADGGGITVKGATDKTFNWIDATDAWTSSEHLHLAAGKRFAADGIRALGASGLNIGDDAGNGIFVQDGGKVGIATTNPGYDLDVDGSGNFASLYVDGNAVLTGEGSIFGKWEDGAAQGEIFYTGGNVGVGTNNPEYPLHVVGNSVVDGNFVVNGTSGNFNVSDFNVSGDSIVLNYGGGALTSNRGGITVKDSSFANKTFEYVEGSDYWNSNVGLNITNGGINVASVSAVDANGLTLGDDAGNGIFVEDGGQIGINTTSPSYNLHVNGSTHVGGEFSVGSEFKISAGGAIGGTAPASDGDIIKWDDANNKWVAGANVGGGGGGGVGEVPLATINSLPSGQSIYEIEFAETYNVEPRIATQLEIDGEGSIIPYVVSGVSTSGYHLIFAQDIPNNNYRIHTTFGGRDVHWETGAGASLYYNDGDVNIQRNFTIGGNLTVNGTTTTVNTETVEIEDHNLVIAANTGYNQLISEYPGAGGAYAGILWGTGDAGAASPVSLTYQTNKGFAFEGGNVGIGTTDPGQKLHVNGNVLLSGFTTNGFGQRHLQIVGSQAAKGDSSATLYLSQMWNGALYPAIIEAQQGTIIGNAASDLVFKTSYYSNGGINTYERMRITDLGNVGIGTANPSYAFELHCSNDNGLSVVGASDTNTGWRLKPSGNDLRIGQNGIADRVTFQDGGNVGIGTTNPNAALHVNSSLDGPIFYSGGTGNTNHALLVGDSAKNQLLRVDNNGNVGIGTKSPSENLEIYKTSGSSIKLTRANWKAAAEAGDISFHSGGTSGERAVPVARIVGLDTFAGGSSPYNGELSFYTLSGNSSYERMRIASNGNVGIGTTNPAQKLDVNGNISIRHQNGNSLMLNHNNSGNGYYSEIKFDGRDSNDTENIVDKTYASISSYQGANAQSGDLRFGVSTGGAFSTAMLINSDGNVGIGTTNPGAYKLYINGTARVSGGDVTSDDRVKHNEQAIVGAIETLGKLAPKKYIKTIDMYEANHDFELDEDGNPVDENGEPVEHSIEAGVIAQQVLEVPELAFMVSPEGVDEDGNVTSPHGLNYNSLFTYAIAAIQEQQSIIESLQSQNASLESRISALES